MKKEIQMANWLLGISLMILGGGMSACAMGNKMSWREEVLLHDGSKIIAERHYNLGGYPGLDAHERVPLDETVTFKLPNNKNIVWKNDFRDSVPEPNSLNHFRFDIVNGVPYLATYPAGCIAYNKWGRPNPPQILFKYENGQWKRITLADLPSVLVGTTANVIVGRPATSLLKSFYTVEEVNAKNAPISTPEYKTILREAIPNVLSRCPALIRTGDGWKSRDWFEDQPSYEACLKFCSREKVSVEACPCNTIFKGGE